MLDQSLPLQRSNSAIIRSKLDFYAAPLQNAYEAFWADIDKPSKVVEFLIILHQIMRASVPLMECAVRRCEELRATDKLAACLGDYYAKHASEELHHDRWALADLVEAGCAAEDVLALTPSAEIASLTGAQYYWVLHHHPVMLLGYLAVLEGYPPLEDQVSKLQDASGLNAAAFRTLRLHSELDPTHRAEFDDLLDTIPLTTDQIGMIGISMLHVADCLSAKLEALCAPKLTI